jgi:hypothetical protein
VYQAEQLEDHTVDDILKVVSATVQQIEDVETQFFNGVNNILDKVSKILKELDCSIEGVSQSWLNQIRAISDDGFIPNPFDHCRREQSLGFTRISSLDNYSLYKFFKCRIFEKIGEKTPVNDIMGYMGEGQRTAAEMRCISRLSPKDADFYTREFVQWGQWYDAWNPSSQINGIPENYEAPELTPLVAVSNEDTPSTSSCANPFDCYTKAMEALRTAQGQIQIIVDQFQSGSSKITENSNSISQLATRIANLEKEDLWTHISALEQRMAAQEGRRLTFSTRRVSNGNTENPGSLNYLDRNPVNCGSDLLLDFEVKSENRGKSIRYEYTCATPHF